MHMHAPLLQVIVDKLANNKKFQEFALKTAKNVEKTKANLAEAAAKEGSANSTGHKASPNLFLQAKNDFKKFGEDLKSQLAEDAEAIAGGKKPKL